MAESVTDKQRANFCGYFQLKTNAYSSQPDQTATARTQLDALFGGDMSTPPAPETCSPEALAREQLENLFKK